MNILLMNLRLSKMFERRSKLSQSMWLLQTGKDNTFYAEKPKKEIKWKYIERYYLSI